MPNTTTKPTQTNQGRGSQDSLLKKFFQDELKDIYWAEKHIVQTLPKMEKAATSPELKDAFKEHCEMSKNHVARLEQIFEKMGKKAQGKKCEAIEGITKEGASIIEDTEKGTSTRDVGLIMAAQKVEHYEIATYGSLAQLAETIGESAIADLLRKTLAEEKETDTNLTDIAEKHVNYEASEEHSSN